jgi:hypothetical protein
MDDINVETGNLEPVAAANKIAIETSAGHIEVALQVFPALAGFELNRRYRTDYRLSHDTKMRTAYAMEVLFHAEVNGQRLSSEQQVNAVLETWLNVEKVFQAVLSYNEVDLELAEEKASWCEFAGREISAAFIAEAMRLIGPMMEIAAAHVDAPEATNNV